MVPLKKLFIVPVIFTFISIHTLLTSFTINLFSVATCSIAILLGIGVGWLYVYRFKLKINKARSLILLPGSWSTMIIIIIIFASKYYFGYQSAIDPALKNQTGFEFSMLAISGICTGLLIGRLLCYLYRYKTGTSDSEEGR